MITLNIKDVVYTLEEARELFNELQKIFEPKPVVTARVTNATNAFPENNRK